MGFFQAHHVREACIAKSTMGGWTHNMEKLCKTSLVAQTVKRLPTMQKTEIQSLGGKDLLEKEMATNSSILASKIPWMEEHGRLQSMGSQRVRHD